MHQPVITGLTHAKHHGCGCRYAHRVSHIHYIQPFFGVAMGSPSTADLVHEYLAAPARDRVKPGGAKLAEQAFNPKSGDFSQMIELRRGEAMKMNVVATFQFAQKTSVIVERKIRVKTTLHQHSTTSKGDHLFDFVVNLFVAVNIALGRTRLAIES